MFEDEQKKLKALRRKQYMQKDLQKKRDVTIFVIDEYKHRMQEFLEAWYTKNKRCMTEAEMQQVSTTLQVDLETVKELERLFLEKRNCKTRHS